MRARSFFTGYTFGAFCIMLALTMVISVAGELVTERDFHPYNLFQSLLINTILAGGVSSVLAERLDVRLLDN
jgi:hypothetical protein